MPLISSVRGSYGSQGRFTRAAAASTNYQVLNMTQYGGSSTITGNGTNTVSVVRTTGTGTWQPGAYSQAFTPPFTFEFQKDGNPNGDENNAYAMIGIVPSAKASSLPGTNNYQWGFSWYPVFQDGLSIYETLATAAADTPTNNYEVGSGTKRWVASSNQATATVFRVSIDAAGTVRYFYGNNPVTREVSGQGGRTWVINYAGYSSSSFAIAYNMRVNQNRLWNATTLTYDNA
jgi:hypothetical protein